MDLGKAKVRLSVMSTLVLAALAGCGGEGSAGQSERDALHEAIFAAGAQTIRIDTETLGGGDASVARRFRRLAGAVDRDLLALERTSESFQGELDATALEDQLRHYRGDLRRVASAARNGQAATERRAFSALRGIGAEIRIKTLGLAKSLSVGE